MAVTVAEVIVDLRTKSLDRTFDYFVPAAWESRLQPGHRVYVSFGKQYCQAYVLAVRQAPHSDKLKPVLELLDEEPLLTPELLQLVHWLCERYGCTRIEALQAIVPAAFRTQVVRRYSAVGDGLPPGLIDLSAKIWQALKREPGSYHQLVARFGPDAPVELERLLQLQAVAEVAVHRNKVESKTKAVLVASVGEKELEQALHQREARARKQSAVLRMLLREHDVVLADAGLQPSDPAVKAICGDGLAVVEQREVLRAPSLLQMADVTRTQPLTVWQSKALEQIRTGLTGCPQAFVMHGVTGSGKTEVYLRAIAHCLDNGGSAIVMVPEISLTPQMVGRFTARFGERVAVLHSGLSAGEKRDEWIRIHRGLARIVIGARSAVFAPVRDVRLIVVDEEHEPSYKQEEAPRYDAREVALWRTQYAGAALVLGSATPSLQAMHDVENGRAEIVALPQRVNGRPLPPVEIVDMRDELKDGNHSLLSRSVQRGLEQAVTAGHQAILFLNRRGYASFMLCRNCGEVPQCPHCDISLTLHRGRSGDWLECHYCGFTEPGAEQCGACGEPALRPFGVGTQQVEHILAELYPSFRVLRMDVDTTRRKGAHQDVIQAFVNGEADVLVGTQMVAKGLDFPNVTFVGVISADTMLSVPDYRSAERTFQLLTQVAGRAGRAEAEGRTVIQTFRPEHYAIQSAARHDFSGFYRVEREMRAAFRYPPYCELAVFTAIHTEQKFAEGAARRFERELKRAFSNAEEVSVLSAVAAGIGRVEDQYRFQVVVKYSQWKSVQAGVMNAYRVVQEKMAPLRGACTLDVNAGRI